MDFSNQDHSFLQIAWKAGTLGISQRGTKRIAKSTIMAFDVPKLCQFVNHTLSFKSLCTRACLLYGASNIMRQQSNILYEDTIQLYKRLEFVFTHPDKKPDIDLSRPFVSAQTITLQHELDTLFEFSKSQAAPSFSDLFEQPRSRKRDRDLYELEQDLSSLLITNLSEQLINTDEQVIDFDFNLEDDLLQSYIRPIAIENQRDNQEEITPFENDNGAMTPLLSAGSPIHSSILSHSSASYGPHIPPLIQEEEMASINTDLYDALLPDHPDQFSLSPVPPDLPRPRAVKRMMMRRAQDTILPSDCYQHPPLRSLPSFTTNHFIKHSLQTPSIITGVEPGSILSWVLFPHHQKTQEYPLRVERSRRFDRRRDALGSSPSSSSSSFLGGLSYSQTGALSIQSTSDIHTPEFHAHFDLGDESHMTLIREHENEWQFNEAPWTDEDMTIDYGFLDFNQPFHLEEELNQLIANRSEVSKYFSHVLELASKGKIRAIQTEPYGPIEIELL
ncbi:hypothetical protein BD560DRAFT_433453 [Blakeslea trispora]|nr:hypothetical protein BD560DRAFT_433453 [Blakeslea trispora]